MNEPIIFALALAALSSGQSVAETATPMSNTDTDTQLSKEIENPVTRRITLPLRYEADFLDGAYKATKEMFSINQAVVPFRLNEEWALITRTKLPAEVLPPKKLGAHWAAGLSNGYTTFFLSPRYGQGVYWDAGPVLYFPTATNSALGVNKWGTGPSAAFLKEDESPWVFGGVVNNIWSLGGRAGRSLPTILMTGGPSARRRTSRPTGSRAAANGPSQLAAALARRSTLASRRSSSTSTPITMPSGPKPVTTLGCCRPL